LIGIHRPTFRPIDYIVLAIYVIILALTGLIAEATVITILFILMTVVSVAWLIVNRLNQVTSDYTLPQIAKMPIGQTISMIGATLVFAYLIQIIVPVIVKILTGASDEQMTNADEIGRLFAEHPWMVTILVLSAPIIEEVVFRGILFGRLAYANKFWIAIVLSSLLFALLHFVPFAVVTFFLLGALLAYLYHTTKRLWAPIVVHFVINSLALLAQSMM
jgi:membrane protease YdiL (CAAX protease family)